MLMLRAATGLSAVLSIALLTNCGSSKVEQLEKCSDACTRVEECDATPPAPEAFGGDSTGSAAADCAANCADADNAVFNGYSDCQIDCIVGSDCGKINDCWDVSTDAYAEFCLGDFDAPDVAPDDEDTTPDNDTVTGSEDADEIVDNPAIEGAIDGSGFEVFFGSTPPTLSGWFHASGTIDEAINARPVGSTINTYLCFSDQTSTSEGSEVTYCEISHTENSTAPIIGNDEGFTVFFEFSGATILFSGRVGDDGTSVSDVEALVVYTHGIDMWEHSWTDWTKSAEETECGLDPSTGECAGPS